jgi:hypothetical protein
MTKLAEAEMDIYSIDKLMHETRQLAAKYHQTTGTALPVTGEIARFDAAKALSLQLNEDASLGYDALGTGNFNGQKILVKGRVLFETSKSNPRIGQINPDQRWDHVVLVLFDDDYNPIEIYHASSEDIEQALAMKPDSQRKKRGAMSVAQFKIIGSLVWTQENGLDSEIWDNHSS